MAPARKKAWKVKAPSVSGNKTRKSKMSVSARRGRKRILVKARRQFSYRRYIFRVFVRLFGKDLNISKSAMLAMDNYVKDMYERIMNVAKDLLKHGNTITLTTREIETAVKLLLPGKLAKFATEDGARAVRSFMKSNSKSK